MATFIQEADWKHDLAGTCRLIETARFGEYRAQSLVDLGLERFERNSFTINTDVALLLVGN